MKKISILLALVLVISCVGVSAAQYNFIVDGKPVTYDEAPFEDGEKLYVPIRAIFEALGANVFWDGETQTVLATTENETYAMQVDRTTLHKSNASVEMDGPVKKVNSRTFVTLDSVLMVFDVASDLDHETNTVVFMPLTDKPVTEEVKEEVKEDAKEEVKEDAKEEVKEEVKEESEEVDGVEEVVKDSEKTVEEETTEEVVEDEAVEEEVSEAPEEVVEETDEK